MKYAEFHERVIFVHHNMYLELILVGCHNNLSTGCSGSGGLDCLWVGTFLDSAIYRQVLSLSVFLNIVVLHQGAYFKNMPAHKQSNNRTSLQLFVDAVLFVKNKLYQLSTNDSRGKQNSNHHTRRVNNQAWMIVNRKYQHNLQYQLFDDAANLSGANRSVYAN